MSTITPSTGPRASPQLSGRGGPAPPRTAGAAGGGRLRRLHGRPDPLPQPLRCQLTQRLGKLATAPGSLDLPPAVLALQQVALVALALADSKPPAQVGGGQPGRVMGHATLLVAVARGPAGPAACGRGGPRPARCRAGGPAAGRPRRR